MLPNLRARDFLPGSLSFCSWDRGWRSLLLRGYREPTNAAEFSTAPSSDHLIVMVTSGSCDIECRRARGWQRARYRPGHLGMTSPGQRSTLRWSGEHDHTTLQLHLPNTVLEQTYQELATPDPQRFELPNLLSHRDPLIEALLAALARAASEGAPNLYAESAASMLAAHLLVRHAGLREAPARLGEDLRLKRAEAFLRAHIDEPVSLASIARAAGMSPFHLLRTFKSAFGETPLRKLTRLRMEEARRLLTGSTLSVTDIAGRCGYTNSAHFAAAFRRVVGTSPSGYRRHAR